jgi:hypothetical protein
MRRFVFPFLLSGCVTLDGFVHNPVHCSTVGESTCEGVEDVWDKACLPCEEPYDWAKSFPWMDGTLQEGESIRSPDPTTVIGERFGTDDGLGELDSYFIPAHGENSALANTTVIYSHGNYLGIEHYQPRVHMLHEIGFNVLVWDFRGYGKSEPEFAPSSDQFLEDAVQIRRETLKYAPDPSRVISYAFSLGGIPALEMAVIDPTCALILEAGFTSIDQIIESNSATGMPASFLSGGHFENHVKISEYAGPVFGMVGSIDRKFPVDDLAIVLEEAPGVTDLWVLEGVDHGIGSRGVPEAGFGLYAEKLVGFLEQHAPDCLEATGQ